MFHISMCLQHNYKYGMISYYALVLCVISRELSWINTKEDTSHRLVNVFVPRKTYHKLVNRKVQGVKIYRTTLGHVEVAILP